MCHNAGPSTMIVGETVDSFGGRPLIEVGGQAAGRG